MIRGFDDFQQDEARLSISEGESFLAFDYRDLLITNWQHGLIRDLIENYKNCYKKNGEWSGGPVNREFDEYFKKRYSEFIPKDPHGNPWKPTIALVVMTHEAILIMTYSLWNWKPFSVYELLKINSELESDFNSNIIKTRSRAINYNSWDRNNPELKSINDLWRKFYKEGKTIFETIEFFDLDPVGMSDTFGDN